MCLRFSIQRRILRKSIKTYPFFLSFFFFRKSSRLIGHFRVVICHCIKTSPRVKPFVWECVPSTGFISCKSNFLSMKGFAQRLVLKQTHQLTQKWPFISRKCLFTPIFVSSTYGIPHDYCHWLMPLMQISYKDCITFWIHISHKCTVWVSIFLLVFHGSNLEQSLFCSVGTIRK